MQPKESSAFWQSLYENVKRQTFRDSVKELERKFHGAGFQNGKELLSDQNKDQLARVEEAEWLLGEMAAKRMVPRIDAINSALLQLTLGGKHRQVEEISHNLGGTCKTRIRHLFSSSQTK
jgi:hypothetical protein